MTDRPEDVVHRLPDVAVVAVKNLTIS